MDRWVAKARESAGVSLLAVLERARGLYALYPGADARVAARLRGHDDAVELRAAELLTLEAAWKLERRTATDMDYAIAKLKASEMLAMVADEALQIHGGMGLMTELPLERIWRDARIERIWDGTSEVQRHIISRALLRPLGG